MRKVVLGLCAAIVVVPGLAFAGVLEGKFEQICNIPAGASEGYVSKPKLVNILLLTNGISLGDLSAGMDLDNPNVPYSDQVKAIEFGSSYCGRTARCNPATAAATDTALQNALTELTIFLDHHLASRRPKEDPFLVVDGSGAPMERWDSPVDQYLAVHSTVNVRCTRPSSRPGQPKAGVVDTPGEGGPTPGRFVVRAKPEDLMVRQESGADFKKLSRASLSLNDDFVKDETAFGIQGVVGYSFGRAPFFSKPLTDAANPTDAHNNTFWQYAIFASYTNQKVSSDNPANRKSVHNLGFGVTGDIEFLAGFHHNLQLSPFLTHSLRSNADVLSAMVLYTPQPSWPGIGTLYVLGDAVYFQIKPQAKLLIGGILDSGNDAALADADDFSRLGPRVDVSLGAWEGTALDGLTFNLSYDYLAVLSGPRNVVHRLETSLDYTLPKLEFLAFQLKYVDGQELNTLEKQRVLSLGLGFKY